MLVPVKLLRPVSRLLLAVAAVVAASLTQANELASAALEQARHQSRLVEEIVVRAQRRDESVNEVPIAVTALSGEQLQVLGVSDARDLTAFVPGLVVSEGGQGAPVYTLRGVGFTDSSYFATPTTAVYLDEVNLPYSIMTKGVIFDVQQVEVLKGPQGTLFGRSTTGGAINFIANKPTDTFEAGGRVSYGRFDTRDIDAYVSGPVVNALRYRIAARSIERGEGWQYSNTDKSRTLGEQSRYAFRTALEWDATDKLSFYAVFSQWRDTSDAQAGQPIAFIPQNPFANDEETPGSETALTAESVRDYPYLSMRTRDNRVAEWCTGDPSCVRADGRPMTFGLDETFRQLALQSQWRILDQLQAEFLASYTYFDSDDTEIPSGAFNKRHAELGIESTIKVVDLEARLSGWTRSERFRWLLGYHATPRDEVDQYMHLIMGGNSSVVFPIPGTEQSLLLSEDYFSIADLEYKSKAPYANVEWLIAEDFKLTLGARYTEEQRAYAGCSGSENDVNGMNALFQFLALQRALEAGTAPDTVEPGGCFSIGPEGEIGAYEETLKEYSLSYRSVLDWRPTPDYLLYVSATRGFKSGAFPLFQTSDHEQLQSVKQERVDSYEIGAKLDLLDAMAHLNLAAFYYQYKDKQLLSRFQDPVFGALPALKNAPKSRVKGMELDVTVTPLAGLYLAGAIAYIDTEIQRFPDAINNRGEPQDLSGFEFNYSPKLSYSLVVDYSLPVLRELEVGVGADYSYTGKTNSSIEADPIFAHPDYAITNARLRFGRQDGGWTVSLWGRNIFNEYVVNSVHQGVGDVKYRITGMPQTYGLTVSVNYF